MRMIMSCHWSNTYAVLTIVPTMKTKIIVRLSTFFVPRNACMNVSVSAKPTWMQRCSIDGMELIAVKTWNADMTTATSHIADLK